MAAFNLQLLERWTRGCILAGPEDAIPGDALRLARNLRLDRIWGVPSSRPGMSQLTSAVILSSHLQNVWISKLFGVSADFSYAQVSDGTTTRLYRLNDSWADGSKVELLTGLSATLISDVNWVDGANVPYKFLVGPTQRKDNGTTLSNFGIAAPTQAPDAAALGSRLRQLVHAFDAVGTWIGTGTGVLATDATIRIEGTNSLTFTVAADTLGSIANTTILISSTHNGGVNSASLVDTTQNFVTAGVKLGSLVRNTTDSSEGRVTRIGTTTNPNDTLFFDGGLSGGTDNDFDTGDAYQVFVNLDTLDARIYSTAGDQSASTVFTDNSGVANKTNRTVVTSTNFIALGVQPGMTIRNLSNGSSATVTGVGTTTNTGDTIYFTTPTGSSENDFDNGDTFIVVNDLVKDDDWIQLWIRTTRTDRVEYIQVDFDLDTTTLASAFANNFYTMRVPVTRLNEGRDRWTQVLMRKSEFARIGTDIAKDWRAVRAIRLSFMTTGESGGITVWLDDLALIGGYGLEGNYEVTAIYRNSVSGGRSNPPLIGSEPRIVASTKVLQSGLPVKVERHPISLTLSSLANPGDAQIDQIRIYLKGGLLDGWRLVDTIADSRTSYTILKSEIQIAANEPLEEDNDLLPSNAVVLFGPGAHNQLFAIYSRNRVAMSKIWQRDEFRAENWPRDAFFLVGDGSSEALNGIVLDTQITIWTEDATWEVQGRGMDEKGVPVMIPVAIPGSHGLAARFGLDYGDGRIFFLARDGIYEQRGLKQAKLTAAIDPFFQGQTINGVTPISQASITTCRLKHFSTPQGGMIVLLYPQSGQANPNARLVLKQNIETGQYTECFFDDTSGINMRSAYVDYEENQLLFGGDNGRVYRAEMDTLNSDDGVALEFQGQTKAFNQGLPRQEKTYNDVVVQANTAGVNVRATAYYNLGGSTESLGNISGSTDVAMTQLTSASTILRRNIGLRWAASLTTQATIFKLGWHWIGEMEDVISVDTDEISFDLIQALKRLDFDIDAPAAVTVTVYLDGTAQAARTLALTSDRQRRRMFLPAGWRGRIFRVTLSSGSAFQLWSLWGVFKPLGQMQGYTARSFLVESA